VSDDPVARLRAQLDEDEAWARAACQAYPYASTGELPEGGVHWRWVAGDQRETVVPDPVADEFVGFDFGVVHLATVEEWPTPTTYRPGHSMPRIYDGGTEEMDSSAAGHIIRHDPARVLADVGAKRKIIDLHVSRRGMCTECGQDSPCLTLQLLSGEQPLPPRRRRASIKNCDCGARSRSLFQHDGLCAAQRD